MKLVELHGVKKHIKLTLKQLLKVFQEESGYKLLGKGHFAYVFKHPNKDEVLKVWVTDEAYEKYVNYCLAHKNQPYLPKIYTPVKSISTFHKRLHGFPEKIKFVRSEFLRPLGTKDLGGASPRVLTRMGHVFFHVKTIKPSDYKKLDQLSTREKMVWDALSDYWNDHVIPEKVIDMFIFAEKMPHFEGAYLDIHDDNVMARPSTGELVISDPVAGVSDIEQMEFITNMSDEDIENLPPGYVLQGKKRSIRL